ncbi:MAG: Uma2 family endonuclease [Kineosporiaceae bacterium]
MTAVATVPWMWTMTADEFETWDPPDDGQRYELLDGVVVVSPSPLLPHQGLLGDLYVLLRAACPPTMRVYLAPLDVRLSDRTVAQPDLLVVRAEDARGRKLAGVPLLTVELLSDSTRGHDLLLKRARYEAAGVPSYWIFEPETAEFTVLQLVDGRYTQVHAGVLGRPPVTLTRPFPLTLDLPR